MLNITLGDFKIILIEKGQDSCGATTYWYRLWDLAFTDKILFDGIDYTSAPSNAVDSIAALRDLICFLSRSHEDLDERPRVADRRKGMREEEETCKAYSARQRRWLQRLDRVDALQRVSRDLEDLGEIADEMYQLSHDDDIEWDEWKDADDEDPAFPIRLRYYNEEYELYYGDPSFDTDHRGMWGTGYLSPKLGRIDVYEIALELQNEAHEAMFV